MFTDVYGPPDMFAASCKTNLLVVVHRAQAAIRGRARKMLDKFVLRD